MTLADTATVTGGPVAIPTGEGANAATRTSAVPAAAGAVILAAGMLLLMRRGRRPLFRKHCQF